VVAADWFMLPFRFLHIIGGVLWVGAAFLFVGFIGPSAAEVGPSAGPLLTAVVKKRKVVKVINALAMTTITAGWVIWIRYAIDSPSLGDWVTSAFGFALTLGGVIATIVFFIGFFGIGRNVERMVDLGGAIAAGGGPPTPEQDAEMQRLGSELERHGKMDLVGLLIAVTLMATARYW
jgi:hypothetical protein